MVKAKIIKFCIAATEKKLLKIYAIVMTGVFLSVWIPAMVNVVIELFNIYF
jgi:hypothetical protein